MRLKIFGSKQRDDFQDDDVIRGGDSIVCVCVHRHRARGNAAENSIRMTSCEHFPGSNILPEVDSSAIDASPRVNQCDQGLT